MVRIEENCTSEFKINGNVWTSNQQRISEECLMWFFNHFFSALWKKATKLHLASAKEKCKSVRSNLNELTICKRLAKQVKWLLLAIEKKKWCELGRIYIFYSRVLLLLPDYTDQHYENRLCCEKKQWNAGKLHSVS